MFKVHTYSIKKFDFFVKEKSIFTKMHKNPTFICTDAVIEVRQ